MYIGTFSEEAIDKLIERIKRLEGTAMGDEERLKDIARYDHIVNSNMGNIGIEYLDIIVAMVHNHYPDEQIKYYIDLKMEEDKRREKEREKATHQLFDAVQREMKELQGEDVEEEDEDAWDNNVETIKLLIESELKPYFTDDQLTADAVDRVFDVFSETHKYEDKYSNRKLSEKDRMEIKMEIGLGIARPMFRRLILKAVCDIE